MGGSQEMDSDKLNVKCTYPDCMKYFKTEKEMKGHKLLEPEHNYCKKCNVDCKDWEDLIQHKVMAMTPFLEGRMKHNEDENPKHIVCEFCGVDFKSFGGRKRHREQNHPADQKIECPGCHIVFARGGNYIAHLEQDRCEGISKREFQSNIQQKHVTKQIMQNPGEYNEIIDTNMALQSVPDKPGLIVDQDSEEGGVAILDRDDEDQKGGYKPLQASVNIMDQQLPLTRSNLETWPRLPGQPPSQLTESMRSMSIKSPTPSMSGTEISASEFASDITSRRGGNKVYTESYPSLGSLVKVASVEDNDDTASEATTTAASPNDYTAAWATGNTSNTLFKDVKPTPPAGDWKSILKHREEQAAVGDRTNLFHSRPWDPNSDDFNIEIFHNPVIEKYCCAFPGCGDTYDEAADLIGHLENAHLKTSFRCPLCLKIFKSAHALVSHSESMGKCKVKNSSMYDRLLDEISGGFLTADHFRQKAVYKPKLDERGMPVEGVMSTRFEAQDARVG